ncbi:MAG: heparan-alpha-glucosaminide N-acetyltransferase domain-containing protein [Candidatus Heimdallarchaeaceae archaeon]
MSKSKSSRIPEIDFLRGLAILVMLFFHSSYYWNSNMSAEEMNQMLQNPAASFALFLGKFAGIFAIISGMANSISINSRLDKKKNKPIEIIYSSFISGLWIMVLGRIHTGLFNHSLNGDIQNPYPDGPTQYSLFVGSIETGTLQIPSTYVMLFKNTPLFVIGMSVMCSGLLLTLLSLNGNHKKVNRNIIVIGTIGTAIILLTQPMKAFLRPKWVEMVLTNSYIKGLLLGFLIGDTFPFFPYAGYAFYGVVFGIAFYHKIDRKKVATVGTIVGSIYMITGSIFLAILGHPDITETFQTLDIQWNLLQIGSMVLICTLTYYIHFSPTETKIQKIFRSRAVRRFGLMTLTIFVMEPLLGTSIKVLILDNLFPNWSTHVVLAFIYGISLIFLWLLILKGWEKGNFVGSCEWITAKVIGFLSFRVPSRLRIKENLYLEELE